MIFIDYPPGGLGNFVAQVLTNSFSQEDHVSFHRMKSKAYDATLAQSSQEFFLKKLHKWKPQHSVAIGHSWGSLDALKSKFDCKIISIEVDHCWSELFLNVYMKAMVDNPSSSKNPSQSECSDFFDYMLQNFNFCTQHTDLKINFDNFYGTQFQFVNEIKKINPNIDADAVYEKFCTAQHPVLSKLKYLKQLSQLSEVNEHLVGYEKALITRLQNKK